MVKLSASKIDTYNSCSWVYYSQYILNTPRSQNDGAKRGDVTHIVLECLINKRHQRNVDVILAAKSIKADKGVWMLVRKHCKRLEIWDKENVSLINRFILVGLLNNFYGDASVKKILPEQQFTITVDQEDKKYCINGFIDKIFVRQDNTGAVFIEIFDYKTSKEKFEGEKKDFNIQDYIYNIAVRNLFPEAKDYKFSFLFLKFPKDPWVHQTKLDDEDVEGFEYYLTDLTQKLENFSFKDAKANCAAKKGWPKPGEGFVGMAKCGRATYAGQLKKDGNPMWCCELKFPFTYYVLINKKGEIADSKHEMKDLKEKEGFKIKRMEYKGCWWFNKKNYE